MNYDINTGTVKRSAGKLYFDDGESIVPDFDIYNYFLWEFTFEVTDTTANLTIIPTRSGSNLAVPHLDTLEVVGYNYQMTGTSVKINGVDTSVNVQQGDNNVLALSKTNMVDLSTGQKYGIIWEHKAI